MGSFEINQSGLDALSKQVGKTVEGRLKAAAAAVEATHAGRPVDEVLNELVAKFGGGGIEPNREGLRSIATADLRTAPALSLARTVLRAIRS